MDPKKDLVNIYARIDELNQFVSDFSEEVTNYPKDPRHANHRLSLAQCCQFFQLGELLMEVYGTLSNIELDEEELPDYELQEFASLFSRDLQEIKLCILLAEHASSLLLDGDLYGAGRDESGGCFGDLVKALQFSGTCSFIAYKLEIIKDQLKAIIEQSVDQIDADDPDAKYKAEYHKDRAIYVKHGVTEEQYIVSRKVDEGRELQHETTKQ